MLNSPSKLALLAALVAPTYWLGFAYPLVLLVVASAWLADRFVEYKFKSRTEIELNKAFIEKIQTLEAEISKINIALKLRDQTRRG